MAKQGEIDYLRKGGEDYFRHSLNKPFSDAQCATNLAQFAAILSVLPPPPARLLDLGCGAGWTSVFFARAGYEVVGIDISPDMILCANQNREKEELDNLRFHVCDYEELCFSGEFDCAVFHDSLHHAVDEELAIRKAFAALKPRGVCVTSEPGEGHHDSPDAVEAMRKYEVTEKDMPPEKIVALGRKTGFRSFRLYPRAADLNSLIFDRNDEKSFLSLYEQLGFLKKLVLWASSWGLGVGSRIFPSRTVEAYFLRQLALRFRRALQAGGIVVMVK
jgi:ubiquinone/menaquinone biosynthesis C-methylase UbiE